MKISMLLPCRLASFRKTSTDYESDATLYDCNTSKDSLPVGSYRYSYAALFKSYFYSYFYPNQSNLYLTFLGLFPKSPLTLLSKLLLTVSCYFFLKRNCSIKNNRSF